MEYFTSILTQWPDILAQLFIALGGIGVFLGAVYAIALKVPGEQPDKVLKFLYDLTVKYSKR